jgi:hypothetical protein
LCRRAALSDNESFDLTHVPHQVFVFILLQRIRIFRAVVGFIRDPVFVGIGFRLTGVADATEFES